MRNKPLAMKLNHLSLFALWIGLAGLCCGAFQPQAAAETELVDRIVAIVNDDVISLYDLNLAMKPYQQQLDQMGYSQEKERQMLFKLRQDILNQLINDKLTDQQVKKHKITISDQAVDNMVEGIKKNNYYTDEQFREVLAKEGLTLEEFREEARERLLRRQLLNREISSKIVITEDEINAYYEAHRSEYSGKSELHLKHIIMRLPGGANSAQQEAVVAEMTAIHRRLEAGESFEALADQFSEPGLSDPGGDLGVFPYATLSAQIQDAVKGLSDGQFTPVLVTDQGVQIFLVYKVFKSPGRSLEDASAEIESKLYEEVAARYFNEWLDDLRARSHIKVIL